MEEHKHYQPEQEHKEEGARILVTGSNGQLGKELKKIATVFPQFDFIFLSREDLPIHHFELVRNSFEAYHPQYCINCAAYTAVDRAEQEKDRAFHINGEAVGVLAAVCKEHQCRLIHISTDYVFDGTASQPYKEEASTNPVNVYGASKLEGEKQALLYNPDCIIIRTSWVYSGSGKNFVRNMLKLMQEKDEINVVNDQFGSPTYAADLAEVILRIIVKLQTPSFVIPKTIGAEGKTGSIYHFSNKGIISWYDLAAAIKELTGADCKINPVPTSQYPTAAKRPVYTALDNTKIQQTFGIVLKDWNKSLAHCIGEIHEES